jgi:hypothetical protein
MRSALRFILPAFFFLFSGCSLLFVQKGSTRVSAKAAEPVPTAVSLASRFRGDETMEYTVGPGDTLASVAQALYGDSHLAGFLAKANRLKAGGPLRVGRVLKVPTALPSALSPRSVPIPLPSQGFAEVPTPALKHVVKHTDGAAYEIEVSGRKSHVVPGPIAHSPREST